MSQGLTLESFIFVSLKKLMLICVPLKNLFALVYRVNIFYSLYHFVHIPLKFNGLKALRPNV